MSFGKCNKSICLDDILNKVTVPASSPTSKEPNVILSAGFPKVKPLPKTLNVAFTLSCL